MKKIVFLDRDGTMNRDHGYTYQPEKYELLSGVKEGLERLAKAGFEFIVITNQSGIGRGMYSEEEYRAFNEKLVQDLANHQIDLLGVFHCPHHPTEGQGGYAVDCDCRKPKPGLIHQAERQHGPFDYEGSWVIGDSIRDIEAAKSAHPAVRGILVPKNAEGDMADSLKEGVADFGAANFSDAIDIILRESEK